MRETQTNFQQMGMASLLPGMIYALELVQKQINQFRADLNLIMNGAAAPVKRGPGRPPGPQPANLSYWQKMTPEERRKEMHRRMAVASGEAKSRAKAPARRRAQEAKRAEWKKAINAPGKKRGGASRGGAASPNHPSNPNHPKHEEFREKMRVANAKSAASRKATVAA